MINMKDPRKPRKRMTDFAKKMKIKEIVARLVASGRKNIYRRKVWFKRGRATGGLPKTGYTKLKFKCKERKEKYA